MALATAHIICELDADYEPGLEVGIGLGRGYHPHSDFPVKEVSRDDWSAIGDLEDADDAQASWHL